jgi:ABC 3 transport family
VGVGYSGLAMLALVCLLVIAVLATCYRPLLFATVDPDVAAARGVPVRAPGIVFAALVGAVAAQAVQIVGAFTCFAGYSGGAGRPPLKQSHGEATEQGSRGSRSPSAHDASRKPPRSDRGQDSAIS